MNEEASKSLVDTSEESTKVKSLNSQTAISLSRIDSTITFILKKLLEVIEKEWKAFASKSATFVLEYLTDIALPERSLARVMCERLIELISHVAQDTLSLEEKRKSIRLPDQKDVAVTLI